MKPVLKKETIVKALSSGALLAVGFLAGLSFAPVAHMLPKLQAGKMSFEFSADNIPQQRDPNTGFIGKGPSSEENSLDAGGG